VVNERHSPVSFTSILFRADSFDSKHELQNALQNLAQAYLAVAQLFTRVKRELAQTIHRRVSRVPGVD
jgi:outer membrane protein OmpA-like peptidoglycan-associated protein